MLILMHVYYCSHDRQCDRQIQTVMQSDRQGDRQTVELFQVGRYGTFMQSIMWQSE